MIGMPQQAAAKIVALINSRPTSPSEAEIVEILGHVGTPAVPMSPAHAGHYREWRRLIEDYRRLYGDSDDDIAGEEKAHLDAINDLARRILATPARTWGDVVLYAEVAYWAQWHGTDPEGPEVQRWMDTGLVSVGGLCDESIVKLIEAVLSAAGLGRPRP